MSECTMRFCTQKPTWEGTLSTKADKSYKIDVTYCDEHAQFQTERVAKTEQGLVLTLTPIKEG